MSQWVWEYYEYLNCMRQWENGNNGNAKILGPCLCLVSLLNESDFHNKV